VILALLGATLLNALSGTIPAIRASKTGIVDSIKAD
jgi:ABC-type lipoprotein release transport system permease subunit